LPWEPGKAFIFGNIAALRTSAELQCTVLASERGGFADSESRLKASTPGLC
jgi:hypothetical protein